MAVVIFSPPTGGERVAADIHSHPHISFLFETLVTYPLPWPDFVATKYRVRRVSLILTKKIPAETPPNIRACNFYPPFTHNCFTALHIYIAPFKVWRIFTTPLLACPSFCAVRHTHRDAKRRSV